MRKLSDVVDNEVVKNTKFNTLKTKVNILEKKIPDATTLIHINQYNTIKQNLEKKMMLIKKKAKISEVENKTLDTIGLVTTTVLNTTIREAENKIPNLHKYITTTEFNKLTAENFSAGLKQAHLVTKTDFDKKLTSFNRKIILNKTKYLEVQKKLNSLITKDYNFFHGRIYFTSNDGSQHTFVYQLTLDMLGLKKNKGIDYVINISKIKGSI